MDGGARVAEVLARWKVPFVFTLVGGHISPILVAAKRRGIRVIDVRHEANTVFAADAVARLTGVPGVAVVTAGPGVTNTLTAIKNAQLAQSPLVLIGGATATMLRGRGSLQDIDQLALIRPHVKWTARPDHVRGIVPALEEAFRQALSGTPGPVFVELAVDLLYPEEVVRSWYKAKTDLKDPTALQRATSLYVRGHLRWLFAEPLGLRFQEADPPPAPLPRPGEVDKAAAMLRRAQRPVLVLGSQATLRVDRLPELVAALERLGVPVYLSGMGRGLLGAGHPLQLRHARREALKGADLVLLAGVPLDFRLDYGSQVARASVVAVNLSGEDLVKNRRPDLAIQADPGAFLTLLAGALGPSPDRGPWLAQLRERDRAREAEIDRKAEQAVEGGINPVPLLRELDRHLARDSVLVGDGGDFVATASYLVRPRTPLSWLDPGVFGTLGVGAGFALGAKLVRPEADVWVLWGDGACGFSLIEVDTFVRHGVPVIGLIGNDAAWAQIERDQVPVLGDDVACRLARTDYDRVAEGLGGVGLRVTDLAQARGAFEGALAQSRAGRPVVINAHLGRTDFRQGSLSM
jgi:acetolactate synthase-1/2/3 large subunit